MSDRDTPSSDSDSGSSSDGDGRYNRLRSTVRRASHNAKRYYSGSEEEGQCTDSDSENEKSSRKSKESSKSPVKDTKKSRSPVSSDKTKETSRSPTKETVRERSKSSERDNRRHRDRGNDRNDHKNGDRDFDRDNRRNERDGNRDKRYRDDNRGKRYERDIDRDRDQRYDYRRDGYGARRDRYRDEYRDDLADYQRDRQQTVSRRERDYEHDRGDDRKRGRGNDREEGKENKEEDKKNNENDKPTTESEEPKPKKSKNTDMLTTKTGGAYIPPARLRMMQANITDKTSEAYQRISWEALKKSINGLVNKVNVSNLANIVRELFAENIVRGRGLIARSIIQAQAASPTFTHVYAAVVAIINSKFPQNGELILRRLILQFKRGYKRNDKNICITASTFIAHLVNQQVAHEVISLEVLTLLLENPTDDSVEVAVGFLKGCGQKLTDVSPRGIHAIFERLRSILHESQIEKRVQYMVEVMFAVRKDGFKDHVSVIEGLDLVEEDDQFTHLITLEDVTGGEEQLNVFKVDLEFQENEEKYKEIKKGLLDSDSSDGEDGSGDDDDSSSDENADDEESKQMIIDTTETNLVALRRTIYLTIQSSLDFEECAHKLLKMELKPGQETELCNMILDCCAQQRTFEKFFALLGRRFCQIDKKYVAPYETIFQEQYETIHRLETAKLRNVAKFFGHFLFTDAISWGVLQCIKLNEDDTTSSSRIFIKILFQELSEYMGLPKLNDRLKDLTLSPFFEGLFPRDNPRNTRFAINFFTSIGLGGLTDELREHLKNMPKKPAAQPEPESPSKSSDDSDSDEDSSSSDSSSDDSSSSDSSSDSEPEPQPKRKSKQNTTDNNTKKQRPDKQKKRKKSSDEEDSDNSSNSEQENRAKNKSQSRHSKKSLKNTEHSDKRQRDRYDHEERDDYHRGKENQMRHEEENEQRRQESRPKDTRRKQDDDNDEKRDRRQRHVVKSKNYDDQYGKRNQERSSRREEYVEVRRESNRRR